MRTLSTLLLCALPLLAADDAPAWLKQAAASPLPKYDAKVRSVVLLDESRVNVEEGGKTTRSHFYAVKILSRDGRSQARGSEVYQTGTGKVKSLKAWVIRPAGEARSLGKDRIVDIAAARNDVYNEVRVQVVEASDDAEVNSVFGYESVVESKSFFTQFSWDFQELAPALVSRFVISVPGGWRADGTLFNHSKIDPVVSGGSYTWELRDLPAVDLEPASPELTSIVPWLAVSVIPAQGGKTGIGKTFENWQDVARWNNDLSEPQTAASPELAQKTQALVSGAKSEFERIAAIGKFAQSVKYVSIQTGVGRGGGYLPHAAAEVFAKAYGDCKDKANLMRAMLKVAGIESFPLMIHATDRARVREEWASPQQFNHAIIAIRLKEPLDVPAAATYPKVGRLLFFDPTDEHTPIGLLPENEESSFALLASPDNGQLIRMPSSPPEVNRLERKYDLTLASDGTLSGTLNDTAFGHHAADRRHLYQGASKADYRKRMEAWITDTGPGASLETIDVGEGAENSLTTAIAFKTPRYAQSMQGSLLVVRTGVLPAHGAIHLPAATRKYPLVLDSEAYEESLRMKLPAGFEMDELPHPVKASAPFGTFSSACEVKDGYMNCRRSLTVKAGNIPVDQYKEARDFFNRVEAASEQPLVLAKK